MSKDKKNKIPDEIKKELDRWNKEDISLPSKEKKDNELMAMKKIAQANEFYTEWENTQPRLKDMSYIEKHAELTGFLELMQAHKKRYKLIGITKADTVENKVRYAIDDIERSHPELKRQNQSIMDENNKAKSRLKIKKKEINAPHSLKEIFVNNEAYNKIMKLLSGNNLIDENSGRWIKTGPGYKKSICVLLNDLYHKHYYNVQQYPTPETLKIITESTFGISISERTFQDKKDIEFLRKMEYSFIKEYTPTK